MTAEELSRLPKNGQLYELVAGELRPMSPAGFNHGAIEVRFAIALGSYVLAHKLGEVVAGDTGFVLSRNPDTVRAPDVGFVRADRIPSPRPVKFWEGAPDLAVEVVSPSDTVYEVDETVHAWLDAGTLEVVVINSEQRTVRIVRPGEESKTLHPGDVLQDLRSVPGFQCPVADLFA
jgi:Uma2 family endonuclease